MFSGISALWRMSAARLAVQLSAVFCLALLAGGFWLVTELRQDARYVVDDLLRDDYENYRAEFANGAELKAWFAEQSDSWAFFLVGFQDAEGRIHGDFQPSVFAQRGYSTYPQSEIFTASARAAMTAWAGEEDGPEDQNWRVYVAPFDGGWIALADTVEQVEGVIALLPGLLIMVGLPVIGLTMGTGLWLGWRQQQRLDHIRTGIARIADGQFDAPLAPDVPRDHLDEVMVGIDRAAAKLDGSFDRLTHFTQSVAHELRTPLARLRAGLEPHADDPAAAQALAQTDEVIRVFEAVQRIARLSGRSGRSRGAPVDLGAVAHLIEELFTDVAEENGQRLHLRLTQPATITGDEQLIAQMVTNLIENGLRHAGPKAEITLSVDGAALTVSDTGQGLSPALRDRLFDSFTRGGDGGGMGLGLALVRAIAEYHDADIRLHPDDDHLGLSITVNFNAAHGSKHGITHHTQ